MISRSAWFFLGMVPHLRESKRVFDELEGLIADGDRLAWKIRVTLGGGAISGAAAISAVLLEHSPLALAACVGLYGSWAAKGAFVDKLNRLMLRTEYLRGYSGAKANRPPSPP